MVKKGKMEKVKGNKGKEIKAKEKNKEVKRERILMVTVRMVKE